MDSGYQPKTREKKFVTVGGKCFQNLLQMESLASWPSSSSSLKPTTSRSESTLRSMISMDVCVSEAPMDTVSWMAASANSTSPPPLMLMFFQPASAVQDDPIVVDRMQLCATGAFDRIGYCVGLFLAAAIRDACIDASTPGLIDHLRRTTIDALRINNPKWLANSDSAMARAQAPKK